MLAPLTGARLFRSLSAASAAASPSHGPGKSGNAVMTQQIGGQAPGEITNTVNGINSEDAARKSDRQQHPKTGRGASRSGKRVGSKNKITRPAPHESDGESQLRQKKRINVYGEANKSSARRFCCSITFARRAATVF